MTEITATPTLVLVFIIKHCFFPTLSKAFRELPILIMNLNRFHGVFFQLVCNHSIFQLKDSRDRAHRSAAGPFIQILANRLFSISDLRSLALRLEAGICGEDHSAQEDCNDCRSNDDADFSFSIHNESLSFSLLFQRLFGIRPFNNELKVVCLFCWVFSPRTVEKTA